MAQPAHVQICNLLYRYAELIDSGQLAAAAELYRHARIHTGSEQSPLNADGLLQTWQSMLKLYPCGTPRTRHMITNPLVEVDEVAGRASCRSYYTVFQATDDLPLQPIITGRYHDEFECVEGEWRFSFRDYTLVDHIGNLRHHLTTSIH
ncbi:nuclear transport factor 2 family protein [Marinobacterium sediminicola]|uniref:SnoaL-like domain-containing protein n=1 Tax=Marinobacterium sediminicola TaxID=518898 RepID=A0ABY1S413_9GAMM|nr:nuclear transport factor 2 family protein [Marinobacterium sediminicola]ULG70151.1 nuclear transport factor 2 family protein [Marinobacterium sediminicola]SMR78379.1 SnoaL-like domain-containing protein [Marinobacterium sediminicola]